MQRDSLLHRGLHHRLGGNLCWSISCPSFCSHFGVCRADFPTFFFPLFSQLPGSILPFLTQAECLQWVCWRWLELAVSGMGKPCPGLTRGCPTAPLPAPGHLAHEIGTNCWNPEERSEHWPAPTPQLWRAHTKGRTAYILQVWVVISVRSEKTISEGHFFLNCYHCINKINNIHQNTLRESRCIFLSVATQNACLTGVLRALQQQWYRFIFLRYQNGNISSQPSYTDKNFNDIQLCHHCRRIKSLKRKYVGNMEFLVVFQSSRTFPKQNISYTLPLCLCLCLTISISLSIPFPWCDSRVIYFYYKTSINMKSGTLLLLGILSSCRNCTY